MRLLGMLIPFSWMPGSWGLNGDTREIAKAEYELTGIDLDNRLTDIRHKHDKQTASLEKLENLRRRYLVDEYVYDTEVVKLSTYLDEDAKKLALLDVMKKHNKLDEDAYNRQRADILKQPWVTQNIKWDPLNPGKHLLKVDYNEYFLTDLREHGYTGIEDDDIVNMWLNDLFIAIIEESQGLNIDLITPSRREGVADE